MKTALAQTDRGIQRGEAPETDIEGRNGGARTKLAILLLEDRDQGRRSSRGNPCLLPLRLDGRRTGQGIEERGCLRKLRREVLKLTQSGAGLVRGTQERGFLLAGEMIPDRSILFDVVMWRISAWIERVRSLSVAGAPSSGRPHALRR